MNTIETMQALVDALGDLSFECCGGICGTTAPTVATYNRAFDVLVKARALLAQMQAGNGLADEARSDEKDSAPKVVQVVEPLTEDELRQILTSFAPSIEWQHARWVEQACARKWGLSLKENI